LHILFAPNADNSYIHATLIHYIMVEEELEELGYKVTLEAVVA